MLLYFWITQLLIFTSNSWNWSRKKEDTMDIFRNSFGLAMISWSKNKQSGYWVYIFFVCWNLSKKTNIELIQIIIQQTYISGLLCARSSGRYWIKNRRELILNIFIDINFYYNLEVDEKKNPLLLFWLETSSPVIPQGSMALSIKAEDLNSLRTLSIYI